MLSDKEFVDFSKEQIKEEIIKIISFLKDKYNQRELKLLQQQLALAESEGDREKVDQIMTKITQYNELLNN